MIPITRTRVLQALTFGSVGLLVLATLGVIRAVGPEAFTISIFGEYLPMGTREHLFDLRVIVDPVPLKDDSDATVTIAISEVHLPARSGHVTVRVESESFKIVPSESRSLSPEVGEGALYVITPKGKGEKKLWVYAQYVEPTRTERSDLAREVEKVVDISVHKLTFLGLSKEVLSSLQAASVVVGFPSILLLLVTRWLDSRRREERRR